ncbi:MAG: hypothetical protein J7619_00035 [Dyadobacter sp.]|uniref:hypothetical protein n=1 Tax=Dyadobacter sp. TaxID=1914288 RepID=UPI001B1063C0|nr:hypothetical protein [Dyadobacter sp.]MBO9611045.1 hypothetical protein [Dyadobacter sp.]
MEVNKLIGYTEITVQGEVIPIKMGSGALSLFCDEYGVKVHEIGSIFDVVEKDGKRFPIPVNSLKCLACALWAGANHMRHRAGQPFYQISEAFDWVDEIGGPRSETASRVMESLYNSIINGGPVSVSEMGAGGGGRQKKRQ